jgi:hypothetical protein
MALTLVVLGILCSQFTITKKVTLSMITFNKASQFASKLAGLVSLAFAGRR